MGVSFRLVLYAPDEASANKAAQAALERVGYLNTLMSDYDSESELMRLCRNSSSGSPVRVSSELFFVLQRSLEMSRLSLGAFDITVGPAVRLWRRARRRHELPSTERLDAARQLVGYQMVRLDAQRQTVELAHPGMRLDLGGIAKGYAADEALKVLKSHGIGRAMIDASGDIVLGDPPPGEHGWRIGIAPLESPEAEPSRFLVLNNASVATSGDAFQHVEIDGVRYSHIIDPKTGLGLTRPASVTVIAADGITSDSLASAVNVLGPEKGLALVERHFGAAALFVRMGENGVETFASGRLGCYSANAGAPRPSP